MNKKPVFQAVSAHMACPTLEWAAIAAYCRCTMQIHRRRDIYSPLEPTDTYIKKDGRGEGKSVAILLIFMSRDCTQTSVAQYESLHSYVFFHHDKGNGICGG